MIELDESQGNMEFSGSNAIIFCRWCKMDTTMMAEIVMTSSAGQHLRRLDLRRDLARVADLVELCFFDTLDPEGRQYLNEMRRAAQSASMMRFASSLIDESPAFPSGYVWEENGQLVGNLSLIPITVQGKKGYMIANVATHPDHRGRGIATALTVAAVRHAQERGASTVWLQVRDDNPTAIHIYEAHGFVERVRRTNWSSGPSYPTIPIPPGVRVIKRPTSHWASQRKWLDANYPVNLAWNIPIDWNLFRPDAWGMIYRAFSLENLHHWSVERYGELKGVLSWKHSTGYTDTLWLAVPEQIDAEGILALLITARNAIRKEQPLSLNFPAGAAVEVLKQAGFYAHQTLIWMEYKINRARPD
jgi:ribosomal protein S18 acetylase RimI-like enzyme